METEADAQAMSHAYLPKAVHDNLDSAEVMPEYNKRLSEQFIDYKNHQDTDESDRDGTDGIVHE